MVWKTFPNITIKSINAGIGGTTSYFGVHRIENDILKYNPDIVFIEYSVNDKDSDFFLNSYNSLVRKVLKAKNSPAIILLQMAQQENIVAIKNYTSVGKEGGETYLCWVTEIL